MIGSNPRNAKVLWPQDAFRLVIDYYRIIGADHIAGILEHTFVRTAPLTWTNFTKTYGTRMYVTKFNGRKAAGGITDAQRAQYGLVPESWRRHPERVGLEETSAVE